MLSRFLKSHHQPESTESEIPRYPPFLKGVPAASPEDLQSTQDELIAKLRQVLGFNQRDFQKLIQPCIDHLASYVHLLQASEHHHHSGAGGLLRHSLEVAFWGAQVAEGIVFVASGRPVEKKERNQGGVLQRPSAFCSMILARIRLVPNRRGWRLSVEPF